MIGVLTGEGGQCRDTESSGLERASVTEHQAPRDTHRVKLAKKTLWKELPTQKKTEERRRPQTVREQFRAHLKGSRVLSGPTVLPIFISFGPKGVSVGPGLL